MPINFSQQPGYRGAGAKPPPFSDPFLRRWTANPVHNARFGGVIRSDGLTGLITIHPVRAMDLIGTTAILDGEGYQASSGVIVLHAMGSDGPGTYADFLFGGPAVPPEPGNVPESATDPVVVQVESNIVFGGIEFGTLLLNGWPMPDKLFEITPGGVNVVNVDVSRGMWNLLVNDGDGYVHMEFNGTESAIHPDNWLSFGISYAGKNVEFQEFLHREVCYPHRGIGFLRRGDGFAEPVMIYQNDRTEDTMQAVGQGWVVGDDEPDDVGVPGMTVLGIPMETPPTIEAIFSAYPAICPGPGKT